MDGDEERMDRAAVSLDELAQKVRDEEGMDRAAVSLDELAQKVRDEERMDRAAVSLDELAQKMDNKHAQSAIVPQVGMSFKSETDAYDMYNSHAANIGFSIRKSTTRLRPDKTIYQKHIVCSNQGERGRHSSHETSKGEDPKKSAGNGEMGQAPDELIGSFDANVGVDMHGDFSAMVAPSIH